MCRLKKIVIVIPKADVILSSITGSLKLFQAAIDFDNTDTTIILAGAKKKYTAFEGLFSIHTHTHFLDIDDADLIIIPSVKSDLAAAIKENTALLKWLRIQHKKGSYIASLCAGSFLLGGAGLLDKKRCTTHWLFSKQFKQMFPKAQYCKHNVITEDNRIFTSGGAFTFLNLIVYLIERFYGKEVAQWIIGVYQIDYTRNSQNPFVLLSTQKNHTNNFIKEAQKFIELNYMKKLSNAEIAEYCKLSERTLIRRFKENSGNTPNEYLQRVRIEKAKELLSGSNKSISEIQFHVGYNDPKTFRRIFLRYTTLTPGAYRKRYTLVY